MTARGLIQLLWKRTKQGIKAHSVTVEYPFVVRRSNHGARLSIRNDFGDCTGCLKCAEVCPVKCLKIEGQEYAVADVAPKTSKGVPFVRKVDTFQIDYNRCISCGYCVDICPTTSLSFDKNFVMPRQQRRHLLVDLVHKPRSLRREQGYED